MTCLCCDRGEAAVHFQMIRSFGARMVRVISITPRPLYPGKDPGTHCTGGWVGLRAGLDGCGKSHLAPGFDSRAVQPRSESLCRLPYSGRNWFRRDHK